MVITNVMIINNSGGDTDLQWWKDRINEVCGGCTFNGNIAKEYGATQATAPLSLLWIS
jgi:hypothetical protein